MLERVYNLYSSLNLFIDLIVIQNLVGQALNRERKRERERKSKSERESEREGAGGEEKRKEERGLLSHPLL